MTAYLFGAEPFPYVISLSMGKVMKSWIESKQFHLQSLDQHSKSLDKFIEEPSN